MSAKHPLFVFTSGFPCDEKSEPFLLDELPFIAKTFSHVYFIPQQGSVSIYNLPANCSVIAAPAQFKKELTFLNVMQAVKWVLSDLSLLLKKGILNKLLRYNVSLMLNIMAKAKYYKPVLEQLAKKGPAHIYSYWSNDFATMSALICAGNPQLTAFSRAHGFDVFEEQTRFGFIPFRKLQLTYLSQLFSVSQRGQKHLQDLNKNFSDKIKYAYLGTADHGLSQVSQDTHVLVSCAYLRRLKGVEFIPDALMHVKAKVKWVHLGGGDLLEEIREKCKQLPANISVELKGNLTPEEITAYYKNNPVSLFISLSEREGLPVTLMEAISFGIPIMATDVGGCSEIANAKTGVLLPKNPGSLTVTKELNEFFSSEKNTVEFRKGVREFWENNFSANKNYARFYKELVN